MEQFLRPYLDCNSRLYFDFGVDFGNLQRHQLSGERDDNHRPAKGLNPVMRHGSLLRQGWLRERHHLQRRSRKLQDQFPGTVHPALREL